MEIFVQGGAVQIDLDEYGLEGHWIEVKERLTYGEEQRLAGAGLNISRNSDEMSVDFVRLNTTRLLTWITDWSFKGPNGKTAKVTRDVIETLNPKVVDILDTALADHMARVEEGNVVAPTPIETAKK